MWLVLAACSFSDSERNDENVFTLSEEAFMAQLPDTFEGLAEATIAGAYAQDIPCAREIETGIRAELEGTSVPASIHCEAVVAKTIDDLQHDWPQIQDTKARMELRRMGIEIP